MAEAILRLLVRSPYLAQGDIAPYESTQKGMVEELGFTQGAVSKILAQFEAGGVVEVRRRHVAGAVFRLKTYQLTPRGRILAQRLASRPRRPGAANEPPSPEDGASRPRPVRGSRDSTAAL